MLKRRDLFRLSAAGLAYSGLSNLAFADGGSPGLLILLHLRGGCDGLNLISPGDDSDFIAARASELRVVGDGPDAGFPLGRGFLLHPAAPGLAELYKQGHLACIHAAGLADGTRSHFVAIDMIDRGIADNAALARTPTGWLARAGRGPAISAAATPGGELIGAASALALPSLAGGVVPAGGPPVQAALDRLYANAPGPFGAAVRESLSALAAIDHRLPRDPTGKVTLETKPAYAAAGELAGPLQTLAQLVKMEIGLASATLDLGGWDTHENQTGRFRGQVAKLSAGLAALWEDLSPWHDRMVVVAWSEFGRRLRSNKSGGTDHGRGGVAMVLGGKVAGGRIAGAWPTLAADRLDEGVDLAVANDIRAILAEALAAVDGRPPAPDVFPGFNAGPLLGLFRRS